MAQTVLNFSIESSDEKLTPRSGTILLGEFFKAIRLDEMCNRYLPEPKSNHSYQPFEMIQPLLLMLHSGGKSLEDIRVIDSDEAIKKTLHIKDIPKADSIGKWLKRAGLLGIYGLQSVNKTLLDSYLKRINEPVTLDIDASVISSYKSICLPTYKGIPGFMAMIGHINGGYMLYSELRDGNIAPADSNLQFVKQCQAQLPKGKKIAYLRADSASYQAELFNHCNADGIIYTIGAKLDKSILKSIEEIDEWKLMNEKDTKAHHFKEEVAEFIHTMNNTDHAFRVIVIKKRVTPMLPHIEELLSEEELLKYANERYSVIATNADESMSIEDIVKFYRQRGDASENRIKEFKNGFNLKYLPTSDFMANALYYQIGMLAYNTFILFKRVMQTSWQKHTIQTIRYKLYNIAGKVVCHARKTILKINKEFVLLFEQIRQRVYEISLE